MKQPQTMGENVTLSVAVIGTGFGGLGMAIRLQQSGFDDITLFEKSNALGGTWRDNTYPGAACDIPSHLYSFSFERKSDWTRKFAQQPEILGYLNHCADKYGLRSHIRFNTEIASAEFDVEQGLWMLRSVDGDTFRARILISACGQLNRPAYPKLPGLEDFRGVQFHSARWDHGADLRDKRVAVIGTGASAIQFVPQITPKVAHLDLYQRTPPYIIPKPDRVYPGQEQRLLERLPLMQKLSRAWKYWSYEARAIGFTKLTSLLRVTEWLFRRQLKREVANPELRRSLQPDYGMGCKRILLANDYYAALVQPKVALVTDSIERITADGILVRDGRTRPADVIIFGTGFQATDFLAPMALRGVDGRDLNQAWRDGAEAYLGISVAGFPNLFLLYGPNTNLGHNSIIYMLESQFRYVLDALQKLRRQHLLYLDVKPEVQHEFNQSLQQRMRNTVWSQGCSSWYLDEAGRNTNNWPDFTFVYRKQTRRLRVEDYIARPAA